MGVVQEIVISLVLLYFVGLSTQAGYCALCLDQFFIDKPDYYNNYRTGHHIRTANIMTQFPCSEGQFKVYECPTSCVHVTLNYHDRKLFTEKAAHMFECASGIVKRLPGYEREEFYEYQGEKKIVQQIRSDVQLVVEFFLAAKTNESASESVLSMYEAKRARTPSYHIPVVGRIPKKEAHQKTIIGIVVIICTVSFAVYWIRLKITSDRRRRINPEDLEELQNDEENQGCVGENGIDKLEQVETPEVPEIEKPSDESLTESLDKSGETINLQRFISNLSGCFPFYKHNFETSEACSIDLEEQTAEPEETITKKESSFGRIFFNRFKTRRVDVEDCEAAISDQDVEKDVEREEGEPMIETEPVYEDEPNHEENSRKPNIFKRFINRKKATENEPVVMSDLMKKFENLQSEEIDDLEKTRKVDVEDCETAVSDQDVEKVAEREGAEPTIETEPVYEDEPNHEENSRKPNIFKRFINRKKATENEPVVMSDLMKKFENLQSGEIDDLEEGTNDESKN